MIETIFSFCFKKFFSLIDIWQKGGLRVGEGICANYTLQMVLINTLLVWAVGVIAPGPLLIVKPSKPPPCRPLPLKLRTRMAVIYSVLSLSIAAR